MWTPLQNFKCDKCGGIIQSPEEGVLEFTSQRNATTNNPETMDFKIIHQFASSPHNHSNRYGCSIHYNSNPRLDVPLRELLNERYGLAYLLSFIDAGPRHSPTYFNQIANNREYTEILRRLLIPHYEEARQYWNQALNDGVFSGDESEADMYEKGKLLEIIQKYAP